MQRKRLRVGDICKIVRPFDKDGRGSDRIGKYVILLKTNGIGWDIAFLSCIEECIYPTKYYEIVDRMTRDYRNAKLEDIIEFDMLLKKSLRFNIRGYSSAWWPSESLEFIRKGKEATLAQIQRHYFNVKEYQNAKVDEME